jgi:uncharacterized membrane protein
MSGDKFFVVFMIVLFSLPLTLAGVNLYQGSGPDDVCPGSTGLFRDVVENTGDTPLEVSVSSSGSASYFSTTVPIGFVLNPGQVRSIFTYITPPSYTSVGNYNLQILANSETLSHSLFVRDCFDYSLVSLDEENNVCPCGNKEFGFQITNNGDFADTYTLSVDGTAPGPVTLSDYALTVNPGETRSFSAYVEAGCDSLGDYEFTVSSTPTSGTSIRSASSMLVVDSCYDFRIDTERDSISICEHSQDTVPIEIVNDGSTSNDFSFDLDGPAWANLDRNGMNVGAGSTGIVNLILSPDYGVNGVFEARFIATPGMGTVEALNVFTLGVNKCHGVVVDIEKSSDTLCNSLSNSYNVNVINTGEFAKEYFLELNGPEWASLNKRSLSLDAGAEEQVILDVNPGFNVPAGSYSIDVVAKAKDSSQVASSDSVELTTVTREECYMVLIGVEDKDVKLNYDTTATVPIVIENIGSDSGTYELSIGGTASNFVYLNPSVVSLDSSNSELVYLYVAPTGDVAPGKYGISISARLEDSTILSTESVDITVGEGDDRPQIEVEDGGDLVEDNTSSPFQRLLIFFKNLFAPTSDVEDVVDDTVEDVEVDGEDITDEEDEEEVPEQIGELFDLEQEVPIQIGDEEHSVAYSEKSDDESIVIVISSDPVYVPLVVGESQEVDLDGDSVNDVLVTFNGFIGDQADITYEVLSEGLTYPEDEEEQEEEEQEEDDLIDDITGDVTEDVEGEPFLQSFASSFKSIFSNAGESIQNNKDKLIIIIVILIVLILIFKTNFLKKLKGFFEEEIEEEPVIIEEKPKIEEPAKKEEKPKKEKKKKEEKLEDEEDFVIEFDEEETEDKKK